MAADRLDERTAVALLSEHVSIERPARARALGGGVSNTVVLVESGRQRIVIKQALPRLRVKDEWLADRARIVREWEVIRALRGILPAGRLPELLFLDPARHLYAMRAAPARAADWKTRLLAGETSAAVARQAGASLGLIARGTWQRGRYRERFGDTTAFDQLRTDPYYRTVARRHPRIAPSVEEWIAESSGRRAAVVHGDWSPKNLLVGDGALVCIDFECAHYGDPSYDAGFLVNHLILKAFHRPALASRYLGLARVALTWTLGMLPREALEWYEASSARHLAFLMLARVDGKSPVEYLRSETVRDAVRRLALRLIEERPRTVAAALGRAESAIAALPPAATGRRPS